MLKYNCDIPRGVRSSLEKLGFNFLLNNTKFKSINSSHKATNTFFIKKICSKKRLLKCLASENKPLNNKYEPIENQTLNKKYEYIKNKPLNNKDESIENQPLNNKKITITENTGLSGIYTGIYKKISHYPMDEANKNDSLLVDNNKTILFYCILDVEVDKALLKMGF